MPNFIIWGNTHCFLHCCIFQYFILFMLHCIDADLIVNSKLKRIMLVSELQTEWSPQNPGSFMIQQDIINTHQSTMDQMHKPLLYFYFFTWFEWIFIWCVPTATLIDLDGRESRKCLLGLGCCLTSVSRCLTSACEYTWDQIKSLKCLSWLLVTILTICMNETLKPHSNAVK